MAERRGRDFQHCLAGIILLSLKPDGPIYSSDQRFVFGFAAEGCEIVFAQDVLGSLIHSVCAQRGWNVPCRMGCERVGDWVVVDAVAIGALSGASASVKIGGCPFCFSHCYFRAAHFVERIAELIHVQDRICFVHLRIHFAAHHLPPSVDSRVGATGAD